MPYPWSAGNVLTATDLNSSLAAKTDTAMTQNAQTGTTYSYVLLDASKLLTMNNASANTVTVTKQATVAWVTGTQLRVMNLGAGVTTLVADTGVTINGNVALKQYQGGTLIRTASDVWLFVPTASSSGMDLITPTSVAGSGVTLSGGQVSFSAATTVSVNGCFTSAYENYVIEFAPTASASSNDLNMRLRSSGSDATGATDYVMQRTVAYVTSTAVQQASTSTWLFGRVSTNKSPHTVRLYAPQLAQQTGMNSVGGASDSIYTSMGYHALATSYDGFTLYASSNSLTGTLRIYGLRNS